MKIAPEYLLQDFREYLEKECKALGTAKSYFSAVCCFFRKNRIDSFDLVTPELVSQGVMAKHGQSSASALKCGLQYLKKFVPSLKMPPDEELNEITSHKRNRRVRPPKSIDAQETRKKIMYIRNYKIKYAFLLMMISGLRVGETAALYRDDIHVTPDGITVTVRHTNGKSDEQIICLRDWYLEKRLPEYLAELPSGERPFYAKSTMQNKATQHGLECHDFRRIAAAQFREQQRAQGVKHFNLDTQDFLRLKRFSTVKRYIYNRNLEIKLPDGQPKSGKKSRASKKAKRR